MSEVMSWTEQPSSPTSEIITQEYNPIDEKTRNNYFIWKKNGPLLYDYIQTTSMLWPSLTAQWFPDIENLNDSDFLQQRILLASHSSGMNKCESLKLYGLKTLKPKARKLDVALNYDPLKNEFIAKRNDWEASTMSLVQKIPHRSDINRARYMPQNPDLIATITNQGHISIFDRTKKPNSYVEEEFNDDDDFSDIKLEFHQSEGWGLDWNRFKEGELASGASDGTIAVWDIKKFQKAAADKKPTTSNVIGLEFQKRKYKTSVLSPVATAAAHDYGVNSLEYLYFHQSLIGSVGDDRKVKIFDTRAKLSCVKEAEVSDSPVNVISFSHTHEFGFVTGNESGVLSLHDIRNMEQPVRTISNAHDGSLTCAAWNPEHGSVLASGSTDGRVKLWDWSRDQGKELLFVHGGHMLGVNDLDWNPHDSRMVLSCSDDNSVQVWKPSTAIF
ncbi:hypothetical protein OGAPHI_000420 [Ogataea philodendri]|uniref:Histone-binding protein RBBP4-like N-terminal domain-containing protein n=1 Tax=Ogataea philodendri TaxID=1378263 RepID=A0A9P8PHG9_9ASCO|nr:uncharacterized protein OGAPHI_000420 [Ogataea philodendri]KAH3671715.1 hypothetical protein OGAPHI_000420 [Ogataea philodendri]